MTRDASAGPNSSSLADRTRQSLPVPHTARPSLAYQHPNHPRRANGAPAPEPHLGPPACPPRGIDTLPPCRASPPQRRVSKSGLSPIQTVRKSHSSRAHVRSNPPSRSGSPTSSSSPRAPAHPGVTSHFSLHAPLQVHQRHHESTAPGSSTNRRLQHPQDLQVPPSPPGSLSVSPPSSPSFSSSSRLPRRRVRIASCSPAPESPHPAPPTTRTRSIRSSPSCRPAPHSYIVKALIPPPGTPTLAMSMQIHAPSPILSTQSNTTNMTSRPSRSRSRPSSPPSIATQLPLSRPPMPRPPSRSEKLLRDTLRRAEEYDRILALQALPSPSLFGATQPAHGFVSPPPSGRRTRRHTASSFSTENSLDAFAYCDTGACYSDEEEANENKPSLLRTPSTSSSSSGVTQGYFTRAPLPRHHSDELEARHRSPMRSPRGSVFSDDPEDQTSTSSARTQLHRSPRSAPSVSRSSFSQSPHASHAHAASRSPADPAERSPCGCQPATLTPHEAVLRSRLEGVLRGARRQEERRRSQERGGYHTGSSSSMASSRNMSGEGDWFFAAAESTSPGAYTYSTRTRSSTTPAPASHYPRSPSLASQGLRSPASAEAPLTPPPTPPFNARIAAAQCKAMDGYVSFADIEGLGMPEGEGEDYDDDEAKHRGGWLKWLPLGHAKRERSDTR